MRRSQGRRSSNTLPIRTLSGVVAKQPVANLSTSMASSAHKRSSSIPRPSASSAVYMKPMYGQRQDQSLAVGVTPSKSGPLRFTGTTPQMGGTTPQSRGNMTLTGAAKPYLKETRNLSDKNCVLEMAKNVARFLNDSGFPESVTHKEIQKIDKQSFMKYFNYIFQFIDHNYQLAPRFNEDELIKNMKDLGYCGTLAKSALVSIGALHSTSQIAGLLSWLCDLIRVIMSEQDDDESLEKAELVIMTQSYNAWCMDVNFDLSDEFRRFYMEKHQVEEGRAEMLEQQIKAITEEYKAIEKKSSQTEELRAEAKKEEQRLEEISAKEVQMQQRCNELQNEERHLVQRLEEIKEKTALTQKEIVAIHTAAKNCKVSADEARRIKSAIAANKRDYAAASEQREQVAKLVEKREMQLANIAAQDIKFDRELNVDLMDMGMTVPAGMDPKEALKNFLEAKISNLSDIESRCIALNERKERILAEISQFKMELKHTELVKSRLEEKLQSVKADRDDMERLYLSQLAELESLSAAPRSDPLQMRQQYELETLQQKFAEQKAQMNNQEKELQSTMAKHAQELKYGEIEFQKNEAMAADFFFRLGDGFRQVLEQIENSPVSQEVIDALIPKPNFK
ncbi:kinetochore protein NDC80 homolog isoform X1 [Daphnia pulicaria]|uniref:kinetochore protein NDC80 homolog isoform X1 n=1 Tax=Daphnia pulicaria TaxID=35523 RepID=UPI001EEA215A|nr:kinetochore protein NDC80 homolog isoform X1 [Daphnia pulicaria]